MLAKARLLALLALTALTACEAPKPDQPKKDKKEEVSTASVAAKKQSEPQVEVDGIDMNKISEALGHFIGRNLKTAGIKFNVDSIVLGLREGVEGKPAPMSDADYEKTMAELQQKAYNITAEANLEAANKFMEENKKAAGVLEIMPGTLQYTVLQEGNGEVVSEHGAPLINYEGRYIDGTVFGSSESTGGPITVPIDQTIPGFSKGIAGMKEGEKRRLFVHPKAGYGRSGQLLPDALLIFDIEVVKAVSPEKEAAMLNRAGSVDDEGDLDDDFDAIEFDEQVIEVAPSPSEKAAKTPTAEEPVKTSEES